MKTPAIQEPLKPLKSLEIKAKQEHDALMKDREADQRVADLEDKELDRQIRKVLDNPEEARRLAREALDDEQPGLTRRRYILNDSTVEKLGEILKDNPIGVLMFRDELVGLLIGLDKDGQEGARSFYLEAWNGNGRYTYDRVGRGTIDIPAAIISIMGGIQPGPFGEYLRAAQREGRGDDGLVQRFQLLVWPDISTEWKNVDRWPNSEARKRATAVFEGLANLEPILAGADSDPQDADGIPFLRFTDEAQVLFHSWRYELETTKLRSNQEHAALESHLAKYRSLIPSLALLIHLADGGRGPVGITALNKAIGWGVYLESHARRIYSQLMNADLAAARALAKKILAGEVADGFALRDVYRKGWSGLGSAEEAKAAADYLVDLDWLAESRSPTPGRTATTYIINPRLAGSEAAKNLRPPPQGTDRTDRRGGDDPSGGSVGASGGGAPDSQGPDGDWGDVP